MITVIIGVLAFIVASLTLGPLSHATVAGTNVINLTVVILWAFVWLTNNSASYRYALIVGLIFDAVSFLPFGFWTLLLLALTYVCIQLKEKFFEVSSLFQSLVVLTVALFIWEIVVSVVSMQYRLLPSVASIFYSVIVGAVVYYVFAIRFKLLQRWLGRRI